MNINFDFNLYDDIGVVKGYDLFIDRLGYIYKIKKIRSHNNVNHNLWSERYLILHQNIDPVTIAYLKLNNSPVEIMVNYLGFVYYSHDSLYYKPVIKIPNPKFNKKRVTEEQLDTLTNVMLFNRENPFDVPAIMGEEEYEYVKCLRKEK